MFIMHRKSLILQIWVISTVYLSFFMMTLINVFIVASFVLQSFHSVACCVIYFVLSSVEAVPINGYCV